MSKGDILNTLKATGEDQVFRRSSNWETAFKLYKEAHPNSHKNMNCGSCFKEVLNWLKS